jgi:hypothetical protein
MFNEDIDRALGFTGSPESMLQPHPDYKVWADSYFTLRNSPEARRAVKWHLNRLKDIKSHQKAIYPPPQPRAPYDGGMSDGPDGVLHNFEALGIREFRQEYRSITGPVFLKAALVLVNAYRTGHTHALFANLEAARMAFPFITKAMAETGQYEATEVAGPTIQSVINLVEVKPDEQVADFLQRMQDDQVNLTKYASAPLRDLISALGNGGKLILEVIQAQIYNWIPGTATTGANSLKNAELVNFVARPQLSLAVNAGLGGPNGCTVFMNLRGDAFSDEGMNDIAKELELVTKWITEKQNWHAPIKGYLASLENVQQRE